MPLFEYECDECMERYNKDIDALVEKLNKTNASKIKNKNEGFVYIELSDGKKDKQVFSIGEKSDSRSLRRFKYNIDKNKVLYLELRNFRFSELIYDKGDEKKLSCPICKGKGVRRVFSTFKPIFDDKNKRAPGPKDELQWHLDYKKQKDEEMRNDWVGQDYLNQYFNR